MKEKLGHGNYTSWIDAEFNLTIRSAQRYINAAKHFPKSDIVSCLPPSVIYKLAAPSADDVREEIVSQIEAGDLVSPTTIVARLNAAKAEASHNSPRRRRDAKKAAAAERKHERAQRELAERAAKAATARASAARLIVDYLGDDLGVLLELLTIAEAVSLRDIEEAAFSADQLSEPQALQA